MKIRQHLWFQHDMETAIELYTSLIPGSAAGWVSSILTDNLNGPAGSVKFAGFTLGNRAYMGFEAGPFDRSEHSSSITVECATQDEADRLRYALGKSRLDDRGLVRDPWGIYWRFLVRQQSADAKISAKCEQVGSVTVAKKKFAAA